MPPFDPFAAPPDNSTPVPGVGTSLTPAQAAALPAAVAAKNAATAAQHSTQGADLTGAGAITSLQGYKDYLAAQKANQPGITDSPEQRKAYASAANLYPDQLRQLGLPSDSPVSLNAAGADNPVANMQKPAPATSTVVPQTVAAKPVQEVGAPGPAPVTVMNGQSGGPSIEDRDAAVTSVPTASSVSPYDRGPNNSDTASQSNTGPAVSPPSQTPGTVQDWLGALVNGGKDVIKGIGDKLAEKGPNGFWGALSQAGLNLQTHGAGQQTGQVQEQNQANVAAAQQLQRLQLMNQNNQAQSAISQRNHELDVDSAQKAAALAQAKSQGDAVLTAQIQKNLADNALEKQRIGLQMAELQKQTAMFQYGKNKAVTDKVGSAVGD